jgi:hypothetical protein
MKKGALELSVNAIVILILAIVMLGLGVTFIRNMFGKTSGQIEEMISSEPDPQQPYLSDPITVSREHIITTSGSTEVVKVSVFNAWGTGSPTTPTSTGPTPFDCSRISVIATGSAGSDGGNFWVSQPANSDNLCRGVTDGMSQMCISNANNPPDPCVKTSVAANKNCTDIQAGLSITTPSTGTAFTVVYAIGMDGSGNYLNYVKCEGLGCGPASGGKCTNNVAPEQSETGDNATPEIWCSNDQLLTNINAALQTYTKGIEPGDTGTFNLVFNIGNIPTQSYLCQVRLKEQPKYSKDFVIEVRRN